MSDTKPNSSTDSDIYSGRSHAFITPFSQSIPPRLKYGSLLTAAGGLVPFTVGTILFVQFVLSITEPNAPWTALFFNFEGLHSFSLQSVSTFDPALAEALHTNTHIAAVNLMFSGITLSLLGFFGFPARSRLSWILAVGLSFWVGGNDLIAVIIAGKLPVPGIPGLLAVIGLILSYRLIFSADSAQRYHW